MTGEMLFFLYAYPCIEFRVGRGSIPPEHERELRECMAERRTPSRRRLKSCFPGAFKGLRQTAERTGEKVWSLLNVRHHWRYHHGHEGICAVRPALVQGIEDRIVITSLGRFMNGYDLELKPGDLVYTHNGHVIEKNE